jgi:hypothetical protein
MSPLSKIMLAMTVSTLLPLVGVAGTGTSTTLITTTTTTSSTLPPACTSDATLDSARCRLTDLETRVAAATDLGHFGARLAKNLDRTDRLLTRVEDACGASNQRKARWLVKRVIRVLVRGGRAIASGNARRHLDPDLRRGLLGDLRDLVHDLKLVRRHLVCPPASPSGAFVG